MMQPSDDLIRKIRFIADAGAELPFKYRNVLLKRSIHAQVRTRPDGSRFYMAGGRFIPKISFTVLPDGSIAVHRYKPGAWESGTDEAVRAAQELSSGQAAPAGDGVTQRVEQEKQRKRSDEIADYEEQTRKNPRDDSAWLTLAWLYEQAGSYKDMESALKTILELAVADRGQPAWGSYANLGKVYLAALSNAERGKGIPIWGYSPSGVTARSLGYTVEEVRNLAKERLGRARDLQKRAGLSSEDTQEVELAYKVALDPSAKSFEEYDRFEEQQEAKEGQETSLSTKVKDITV